MADVLRAEGLRCAFGQTEVLRDLGLAVGPGEIVAIVGPSGCGKSTLLGLLAGFERPDAGTVTRGAESRMLHQQSGLFPWLTVAGNVGMGLPRLAPAERQARLAELLELVRLAEYAHHYPHQLSGGMRQRAELARALASEAGILLLDEPFSALDYPGRLRMRFELERLLVARPRAVVLVTHDLQEAVQLADRVVVLSPRPATVQLERTIDVPRPRDPLDPRLIAVERGLQQALGLYRADDEPAQLPPPPRRAHPLTLALAGLLALGLVATALARTGPAAPGPAGPTVDARPTVRVGHLPVTCHLTCPVTAYATRTSQLTRFESVRFTEFASIAEAIKAKRLLASFIIVPLAMKLREQGVPVKICYLGHRDGSTVMVRKADPAKSLRDLRGKFFAIPSRYSNQALVIRKLMADQGMGPHDINFVELPPPDMPGALAAGAIDAYFVGEPFAAKAELAGTGRVLYLAKDIWPGFISCVLVVHEQLINDHPEQVRDLVRGIAASGEWAETHRLAAARVAAPYFRQDEALVRFVLTRPPDRVSYRMLTPKPGEMEAIRDMGLAAGILSKRLPVSDLLDLRFIPTPAERADATGLPDS